VVTPGDGGGGGGVTRSKAARRLSLHGDVAVPPLEQAAAAGLGEVHGVVRVTATRREAARATPTGQGHAGAPDVTRGVTSGTRSLQDKLAALGLFPGAWCGGAAPLL
jgi:hypothetical protein